MFPELASQQRGQIDVLAGRLNNAYTRDAAAATRASLGDASSMAGLGQSLAAQSARGFGTSGPTSIEQALYDQGQAELALGRSLSPEQMREATQGARSAFAARGMATGNAAAGAELLNRDAFATQRQDQRRQFAASANQMREENVMSRRDAAGRLGALGGNIYGAAAGARQSGANTLIGLDPYGRAINPGMTIGQSSQQLGMQSIGENMAMGSDLAANTGSFNTNRMDSLYNSWMNNATAVQTGQMSANSATNAANISAAASRRSGNQALLGAGIGAVGGIAGAAIIGIAI
jgi:hypothetical protein